MLFTITDAETDEDLGELECPDDTGSVLAAVIQADLLETDDVDLAHCVHALDNGYTVIVEEDVVLYLDPVESLEPDQDDE
jgi:hypothetical protein